MNNTFESFRDSRNSNGLSELKDFLVKYYPFIIGILILGGIVLWSVQNFLNTKSQNSKTSVQGLNEVPDAFPTTQLSSEISPTFAPYMDPSVLGSSASATPTKIAPTPTIILTVTLTPIITPTPTLTPTPTITPAPTNTPTPPSATDTPTGTPTPTSNPTPTSISTPTPTIP